MITVTSILECEKYLEDIDAVIFDLDDTLYSEKNYVRSGYSAVSKAFPKVKDMDIKLWNAFENKLPAIDYVLSEAGIFEYKAQALDIYRNHIPDISLYEGVEELLQRLSKCKRLGMITDGRPEGQKAKITALNIGQYFERVIITDELGGVQFRKPDKHSFIMMQKAFNVPFDRIVYIGDNLSKDFIAPRSLGMKVVHFNNPDGLYSIV